MKLNLTSAILINHSLLSLSPDISMGNRMGPSKIKD